MKLTPEKIADLSCKVENFIELELGSRLPYISLLCTAEGQMAFFTNRRSNDEVRAILEAALEALDQQGNRFTAIDGELT